MCATRGDGARALNLARDQRTSNCGPPQEKFMVCYTVLVLFCAVLCCCSVWWEGRAEEGMEMGMEGKGCDRIGLNGVW